MNFLYLSTYLYVCLVLSLWSYSLFNKLYSFALFHFYFEVRLLDSVKWEFLQTGFCDWHSSKRCPSLGIKSWLFWMVFKSQHLHAVCLLLLGSVSRQMGIGCIYRHLYIYICVHIHTCIHIHIQEYLILLHFTLLCLTDNTSDWKLNQWRHQIESLWQHWSKQIFHHHFSNSTCLIHVSVPHIGNSHNILNTFIIIIFVMVIFDQWSLMLLL